MSLQIQTSIQSHAIIILPNTDGIELLVCYEDEGVYVNTYGRITKDVVLQWGEMPTSVGESHGLKLRELCPSGVSPLDSKLSIIKIKRRISNSHRFLSLRPLLKKMAREKKCQFDSG